MRKVNPTSAHAAGRTLRAGSIFVVCTDACCSQCAIAACSRRALSGSAQAFAADENRAVTTWRTALRQAMRPVQTRYACSESPGGDITGLEPDS